jgi:dTDP-4-dehydrorhamnose 3,5-epimerase/reductase
VLTHTSPYGTYNVTNSGPVVSWADIAKTVYKKTGHDPARVTGVTTAEYYNGKKGIAPRPLLSELDLSKIKAAGFTPRSWQTALNEYIKELAKGAN